MKHIYQQKQFGEEWFTFPNLYSRIVKLFESGSKFVEVGCWKGKSSSYMAVEIANSNKDIEFYCVDTWNGSIEHQNMDGLDKLYDTFITNMKPVEKYYFPLKLTSLEAAQKFKDNSLDFVFLDASHEYSDVKEDIKAWLPKVKSGGILAGHDYSHYWPQVKKAVDEMLPEISVSEQCFIFYKNKLANFPSINCVSIEESFDRRSLLTKKMSEFEINNINYHIFPRYKDGDCKLIGSKIDLLPLHARGPVTSHLKAIKNWLNNSDDEYTFFCEDDLGLHTVPYWNFNWNEFYINLPADWDCIQLVWIREPNDFFNFGYVLRNRYQTDSSGCGYLIKRDFARKLINHYHPNDYFFLEYQGFDIEYRQPWALIPTMETIVFSNLGRIYSFPLFVENIIDFKSSHADGQYGQRDCNYTSHHTVVELWKNTLSSMSISEIIPK